MDSEGYLRYQVGSEAGRVICLELTNRFNELLVTTDKGERIEAVESLPKSLKISRGRLRAMHEYLKDRGREHPLYHDMIERWGFLHSTGSESEPCCIKRIILSTGKTPNFPQPGYHASSKETGGSSEFWPIDFHTLRIRSLPSACTRSDAETDADDISDVDRPFALDADEEARPPHILPGASSWHVATSSSFTSCVKIASSRKLHAQYLEELDEYCQLPDKLDTIISIHAPGDRPSSRKAKKLKIPYSPNFCISRGPQCLRAAIATGLRIVEDDDKARKFLKLGPLSALTVAQGLSYMEAKIKTSYGHRLPHESHEVSWLMQQPAGVFIVRLEGRMRDRGSVDHAVCLYADKGRVYDPLESDALRLTEDTFDACVGDGVELRRIVEVRQLKRQAQSGTKKKNRPKTTEQRRRQKERKTEKSRNEQRGRPPGSAS